MKVFIDWSIKKGYLVLADNNGQNEIKNFETLNFVPETEVYIESGCPKFLLYTLIDKDCKIFVVQGKETARLRSHLKHEKTDENDVKVLQLLYKENSLLFVEIQKPNINEIKLKYLMGKYEILTKILTGFKNQSKSAEKEYGSFDFLKLHIKDLEKEKLKIIKSVQPLISTEMSKISIRGINTTLIARLLSQKHPKYFSTLSRWLAYCGYKGYMLKRNQKGKGKRPNYTLKSILYLMATQTIKCKDPNYSKLYYQCKEKIAKEHLDWIKGKIHGKVLNIVATFIAKEFWKKLHKIEGEE